MAGGLVDWNDGTIPIEHKVFQLVIQSLCVVCVNCFLIISGWFGLKLKFASVWKMWTLLVSIYVPFYLVSCILGSVNFSLFTLITKVLAFPCESYFVQNYMMLLFISPVLNSFIESHRNYLAIYALCLFLIEVVMESIFNNRCLHIEDGYSLFHFVTIYMMARAAYLYRNQIQKVRKRLWVFGYFLCAVIVCLLHLTSYRHNWAYSNPVVIIESFMLFFPFLYYNFHNRIINWIAGGTFVVYIIQVTNPVCGWLFKYNQYALLHFDYNVYLPLMLLFCIFFFAVCFLYNVVMSYIMIPITQPISNLLDRHIAETVKQYF